MPNYHIAFNMKFKPVIRFPENTPPSANDAFGPVNVNAVLWNAVTNTTLMNWVAKTIAIIGQFGEFGWRQPSIWDFSFIHWTRLQKIRKLVYKKKCKFLLLNIFFEKTRSLFIVMKLGHNAKQTAGCTQQLRMSTLSLKTFPVKVCFARPVKCSTNSPKIALTYGGWTAQGKTLFPKSKKFFSK